jgi:hypothetical protein
VFSLLQGAGDRGRHVELLRTLLVVRQPGRDAALSAENVEGAEHLLEHSGGARELSTVLKST